MDAAAWKGYNMAQVNRAIEQQRRAAYRVFRAYEWAVPGRRVALEWPHRHRRALALLAGGLTVLVVVLGLLTVGAGLVLLAPEAVAVSVPVWLHGLLGSGAAP